MDAKAEELDIIGTSFSTPTLVGEATPPLVEDVSKHENVLDEVHASVETRSGKRRRTVVESTDSGKRQKMEDKKTVGCLLPTESSPLIDSATFYP